MASDQNPQSAPSFIEPAIADAFTTAKASIPPTHRLAPLQDEVVESREAGYARLQEWAFCNGYALAIESSKPSVKGGPITRIVVHCVHHKETTRNSRNIKDEERRRVSRKTQANGCKFAMYISRRKRLDGLWAIGYTHPEHNHDPLPDPFQYDVHRTRKPGYTTALTLAASHLGIISYGKSKEILQKEGLHIDRKTFYNLKRREGEGGREISARISTPLYATTTIKQLEEGDNSSQIREWDAVEAIKRRLIASGSYSKERRVELIGHVWAWIKADSIQRMVECREKLLSELQDEDRAFLVKEYQPKEHQLMRAYTKTSAHRASNSAQQGNSSRIASKEKKPRVVRRVKRGVAIEAKPEEIDSPVEPILSAHDYVFGSRKPAESTYSHNETAPSNGSRRKRSCTGLTGSAESPVDTRPVVGAGLADSTGPTENTSFLVRAGLSESKELTVITGPAARTGLSESTGLNDNTRPAANAGLSESTGPNDKPRPAAKAGLSGSMGLNEDIELKSRAELADSTGLTEHTKPTARAEIADSTAFTENTGPACKVAYPITGGCASDPRLMSSDHTMTLGMSAQAAPLPEKGRIVDGKYPIQKSTEVADLIGSARSAGLIESPSSTIKIEFALRSSDIPEDSLVRPLAYGTDDADELRTTIDSPSLYNKAIPPENMVIERESAELPSLFRAVHSFGSGSNAGPEEITTNADVTCLTGHTGNAAAISHSQPLPIVEDQNLEEPTDDGAAASAENFRKRKRSESVDSKPLYSLEPAEDGPLYSGAAAEDEPIDCAGPAESAESAEIAGYLASIGSAGSVGPAVPIEAITPARVILTPRSVSTTVCNALVAGFTALTSPFTKRRRPWEV